MLVGQSCPTLCDPVDCSPPGSSVHEIFHGLPFPSPGDLPNPGIEPGSPGLQADSLPTELQGKPLLAATSCTFGDGGDTIQLRTVTTLITLN